MVSNEISHSSLPEDDAGLSVPVPAQPLTTTPESDLPEPPEETEPRTVFVGDLSFFCTEEALHDLFETFGPIESVQLKGSNDGKPHLSYGFIRFQYHDAALMAVDQMDGQLFLGRAIRVGWASDDPLRKAVDPRKKSPRSSSEGTAQVHVNFTTKDHSFPVTEASLRDLFSQFGELLDVTIKKTLFNKHTGAQTGYGFVHYALNNVGIASASMAVQATNQVTFGTVTYESSFSRSLRDYIGSSSSMSSSSVHDQADGERYLFPSQALTGLASNTQDFNDNNYQPQQIQVSPRANHIQTQTARQAIPTIPPPVPMPIPSTQMSLLPSQYTTNVPVPPGHIAYFNTVLPPSSFYYPSPAPTTNMTMAGAMMAAAPNMHYAANLIPPPHPTSMAYPGLTIATGYPPQPPAHHHIYPNPTPVYFETIASQPPPLPPLHLPPHANPSPLTYSSSSRKSSPTSSINSQATAGHQQQPLYQTPPRHPHQQQTPQQQPHYQHYHTSPSNQYASNLNNNNNSNNSSNYRGNKR